MVTHFKKRGRVKETKKKQDEKIHNTKYIKNTQNYMTYCTTLRGYGCNTCKTSTAEEE